jgi:hypothetical protein
VVQALEMNEQVMVVLVHLLILLGVLQLEQVKMFQELFIMQEAVLVVKAALHTL